MLFLSSSFLLSPYSSPANDISKEAFKLPKKNGDGDSNGNKDGERAIGFRQQNHNFASASRVFVHFFAVVARLRSENASFHF